MTGSLVIEKIFAIPGIGEQFVKSVTVNDYSVIMGTTITILIHVCSNYSRSRYSLWSY